jgi:hypothetical protein
MREQPEKRFKHRLALALGCFVHDIDRLPSSALTDWIAYYSLEPFGQERENFHAAIVASTVANASGSKKRFKPDDFMIKDPEQQKRKRFAKFKEGLRSLAKKKSEPSKALKTPRE